jgi:hypothetical protein
MKKIGMLAFVGAFVGIFASFSSLYAADLNFSGDFRVRGIYGENLADADDDSDDSLAFADGRFRFKISATAGMTTAVTVVDYSNNYNEPGNAFCPDGSGPTNISADICATGNYRFGSVSFGNTYGIVGVREAYLKLDFGMTKLALGRKPFKLGNSLILDDTMDAIAAKIEARPLEFVLATGKLRESNDTGVAGNTGDDTDLYLLKANFTHDHPKVESVYGGPHEVGLFLAYMKDRGPAFLPADDKTEFVVYGATVDGVFGPVTALFEANFLDGKQNNLGTDIDLSGFNVLVGGGANVASTHADLTFLYTSGEEPNDADDTNINGISGNYALGNILGSTDINSDRVGKCASVKGSRIGSGGASCVGGLGYTAVKLNVALPNMMPNCRGSAALIWAKTTENASATAEKDLGIELDLNATHKLDEHVSISVNLGYLFSGDAWKTIGPGDDDQMKGVASVNYTF